eukprot:CAMPEP_0201573628 /NCGR_PEP_ID=MMETSP0190_2-20130828/17598_1 /ASSEMBLY_ACC=CAM_ASM_000263 /TAXON_ID=37353 /ORGANISM="Rosalina sp." /LENGTH=179 /DNA_ID=CAMNT_0048000823 /DNA_START=173 /DNA_END=709 /DNA_ORIENTATION=+
MTNPPYVSPTPTPAPQEKKDALARHWINDDFVNPIGTSINSAYTYGAEFWWFMGNSRWYMSPTNLVGTNDNTCFCDMAVNSNSNFEPDNPRSITCDTGDWKCNSGEIQDSTIYIDQGTVTWGRCPEIRSECGSIKVTAHKPFDLCNGIYDAVDYTTDSALDDLDNEINIFRNRDDTAVN